MTQPSQPVKPTNPFASAQRPTATPPQAQQPASAPAARPSSLSRFGPPRTHWRIVPVTPRLIRFDLSGLGDPFYRLLGRSLQVELGQPSAVIKALENGDEDVREIANRLDTAWIGYSIKGAVLMYLWRTELPQVFDGRIPGTNESEMDEVYDDDKCPSPTVFRALDYTLVLNVLARTRANILLPDAPLGLEGQYLNRSLFTEDARLIALAMATGCIEESGTK